ncbi:D-threo-aldose 1-dehydrogenase [Paracoccus isoporae]|uniref:D-threo-aldose 1-dehydrogenase n=1 Tax=Paracoccus isoporae TaxID=591205 RepID=A0A1G7E8P7_9RHOB|nr:aldo/keto reductase [Paracoccus isoporae]SDE60078.1 D-threo-aldose 1-dehydrogenase [Paracoccus isoporae]
MAAIRRTRLGQAGPEISQLGLGCATLGGLFSPVSDADAGQVIDAATSAGVTYFDAAPFYGHGLAEHRLGQALRGCEAVISTKVGRLLRPGAAPDPGAWVQALPFTPVYDYSYDGIMRSFEDSLQRLGRDRIEILFIHDIGNRTHGEEDGPTLFAQALGDGYRALEELRDAGVVGAIGLGVNESEVCLAALAQGQWDAFLLAGRYSLLEQVPLDDLFPRCTAAGTDIVIGGPFNSGVLAGADSFDYGAVPPAIADRVTAIRRICADHGVALPAAALAFCRAHPLVKSTIPGPRSPREMNQIVEWWHSPIPTSFWSDLKTAGLLHEAAPTPQGEDA